MTTIIRHLTEVVRHRGEFYALLTGLFWWYLTNLKGALFIDESIYARTGWLFFHGDPYANPTHIFAPTAKYFIGIGQVVFGTTSIGARAPILLLSLLTIAITYELGVLLDRRVTGFLAALLLGVTYPFARHSVMAMLDIPLAFFFIALLYVTLQWIEEPTSKRAILVGVLAAAVVTTKAYGFLYTVAPLVAVAIVTFRRSSLSDFLFELRWQIAGGVGSLAIIYTPFILIRHPPVGTNSPIINFVLQLPIVGNLLYVFGAAIKTNLSHIGEGHAVAVGSTIYQYPPVWTYIYWLFEWGAIYIVALVVVVVTTVRNVVRTNWNRELVLQGAVLIPFLALSLMTVKFHRYILPVLPLLLVLSIANLRQALNWLYTAVQEARDELFDIVVSPGLVILVLGASLVPPSPVVASMQTPIGTDSGYDRVAEVIEGCSVASSEVVVLSYHAGTLDYYLSEEKAIRLVPFTPTDVQNDVRYRLIRNLLISGQIDAVVTPQSNPRLRKTQSRLYRYIRQEGELQAAINQSPSGILAVYTFGDLIC